MVQFVRFSDASVDILYGIFGYFKLRNIKIILVKY